MATPPVVPKGRKEKLLNAAVRSYEKSDELAAIEEKKLKKSIAQSAK